MTCDLDEIFSVLCIFFSNFLKTSYWFFFFNFFILEVKVKVTQSCSTLCNPMDYTVRGILLSIYIGVIFYIGV